MNTCTSIFTPNMTLPAIWSSYLKKKNKNKNNKQNKTNKIQNKAKQTKKTNKQTNKQKSFHYHWFQANFTLFQWECSFEETMPKLLVNFENHISQDSQKNLYPGPDYYFSFTAPKYSDKCWSNLPLNYHIFLISNIHRNYSITCAIIRFMLWSVSFGTSYHVLLWKHNKMTSSVPAHTPKKAILMPYYSKIKSAKSDGDWYDMLLTNNTFLWQK